ncbi:sporulation protein YabP [Tepidibacter thalassicus]|uniref:Sporulation protein YabP n=1 Tax=Tepidibacter thalassicus DSM 15285 TaxID=1123350 RepID=A0A1M5TM79_9FIRM|nr:sporulation protein YabP [Tepidibacter thalassicus]SHH51779.1 sporulation protein YabP [Tepidibacter thalassicus DSM 15285]
MEHILNMKNREELSLSGIEHIYSFNNTKIELKTVSGDIVIEGENLDMGKLSIDDGMINVKGSINSIAYSKVSKKDEEGFFKKLFK